MRRMAFWTALLALATIMAFAEQKHTRGVGVYPGNPSEDFAPGMIPDPTTYRNLALHRPAYHSSSYDYNLTAQLLTDGIKESKLPRWIATTLSTSGLAKKNEREFLLDHNSTSNINLGGPSGWIQFELGGETVEIDRIDLDATIRTTPQPGAPKTAQPGAQSDKPQSRLGEWTCTVMGSDDGQTWKEIGNATGDIPPAPKPPPGSFPFFGPTGPPLKPSVPLAPSSRRFYRIMLKSTFEGPWTVSEVTFFSKTRPVEIAGPYSFTSAWMPESKDEEWAYVDLGARCSFDRIVLYWIRRASEGVIQTSDDAKNWKDILTLESTGPTDDLKLNSPEQGRYVRVLMKRPGSPEGYILSELEVYGRGGLVPKSNLNSALPFHANGGLNLDAGAWRLQRDSLVTGDGTEISKSGFKDVDWIPATVPATVLSSYWNIGAIPDPNFGTNQLMISDSFFYADFWYRTEFNVPAALSGQKFWLHFDGINWKAEVYLNGEKLGRIEGAFTRGRFDVSDRIRLKEKNALAVRIEKNATPGSMKQKTLETAGLNGGALGADNPTYHASIGWDWIPTVRGRNIGIWDDVCLTASGPVTIENPFVKTTLPLPDTTQADVKLEALLNNSSSQPVNGNLRGHFGDMAFDRPVTIEPASVKTVTWETKLSYPRLWWPAGYGAPNLYDVELRFETDGKTSDTKSFRTGVRQFTYSEEGGALKIWINGRRFVGRGGNWGFPETNLRYRGREYDIAVGYHKDMNFTMIRNWVGQTGDEEFYEACDKHGIVVWQDFWLANPVDGPNPDDSDLFLRNVQDFVLRIRNHPSIGLYCGRNEGDPPKPIDDGIRKILPELDPGLHYISNSAWGVVSGGGPYAAQTPKYYFKNRATTKLHSELGMPNIVTFDSLRQMMPEGDLWPQGLAWGLHDFNLNSAQRLSGFRSMMDKSYGGADNAKEWVTLAQFINYDGYRAIFEAQSKNRMGILLWMSHPCWPSFVWQTYDYYFDPTAGYFGSKKGSEPLHIQWNPVTDTVEVVNYSAGSASGLMARAEILNIDGSLKWKKTAAIDSTEDSVGAPITMEYPKDLSSVHFIRLNLTRGERLVSENFYWRGAEEGNYTALRSIPKASLAAMTRVERKGSRWILKTELNNISKHPALMVRLRAVRMKSRDRILPALFSDNYVSLMPGERRTIQIQIEDADTRGESPGIVIEGFNIK
jgi:hypothetical protein